MLFSLHFCRAAEERIWKSVWLWSCNLAFITAIFLRFTAMSRYHSRLASIALLEVNLASTWIVEGNFWWRLPIFLISHVCWSMCALMVNRNKIMLIEKDCFMGRVKNERNLDDGLKCGSINFASEKLTGAAALLLSFLLQRHSTIHNLFPRKTLVSFRYLHEFCLCFIQDASSLLAFFVRLALIKLTLLIIFLTQ